MQRSHIANVFFCLFSVPKLQVSHNRANGPLKFSSARKMWPLLDLLAKFRRVLASSLVLAKCSQFSAGMLGSSVKFAQIL